jgi:hypothetical protein
MRGRPEGCSAQVVWRSLRPLQFAEKASEYEGSPLTDASLGTTTRTCAEHPEGTKVAVHWASLEPPRDLYRGSLTDLSVSVSEG